jgi:hypothetical protein
MLLAACQARADVAALGWLAGCWAQDGQEPGSLEQWTAPAGGTMFGISRTVKNGRTIFFEFLRIVEEDDGWTGLIAAPSGQETARFKMTVFGPREVAFENPAHDFPQRISYRLIAAGKLLGRIEGTDAGKPRSADFPMTAIACDVVERRD